LSLFFKSLGNDFTCSDFKKYFAGKSQWTLTKFGNGANWGAVGSRPIDELLSAMAGNEHPDFACLEERMNGIKKNIFSGGIQSGLTDWQQNLVLVAETAAVFEYLEEVGDLWQNVHKRVVTFFQKVDSAAVGTNVVAMKKFSWEQRHMLWIREFLGSTLDAK